VGVTGCEGEWPMSKRVQGASDQDLDQLTGLFRLLSDKTRLNILMLLSGGERNVTNLCEALQLPQPTVSHHLGLLRLNNVIGNRRSGKQVFYTLNGRVDTGDGSELNIRVDNFDIVIKPKLEPETEPATTSSL
jgi:DNA-binding transcriptional ArsR family regulator